MRTVINEGERLDKEETGQNYCALCPEKLYKSLNWVQCKDADEQVEMESVLLVKRALMANQSRKLEVHAED